MKSKDDLKEIDIFDDITRFWDRDTDFNDILFDEKKFIQNFNECKTIAY